MNLPIAKSDTSVTLVWFFSFHLNLFSNYICTFLLSVCIYFALICFVYNHFLLSSSTFNTIVGSLKWCPSTPFNLYHHFSEISSTDCSIAKSIFLKANLLRISVDSFICSMFQSLHFSNSLMSWHHTLSLP